MCGKFTFMATWAEVVDFSRLLVARPTNAPEETATPMRFAPVMHLDKAGARAMTPMRWGFSKLLKGREVPDHMHARDDKVLSSRLWRPHLEERRGLLVVSSFNEGQEVPTYKPDRVTPTGNTRTVQWTIRPKDGSRLAIAILYREQETPAGQILEFVMCTTKANKGISEFVVADPDQRMPAVLAEDAIPIWLGEVNAPVEQIPEALRTYEDNGAWDMQPAKAGKPRASSSRQDDLF